MAKASRVCRDLYSVPRHPQTPTPADLALPACPAQRCSRCARRQPRLHRWRSESMPRAPGNAAARSRRRTERLLAHRPISSPRTHAPSIQGADAASIPPSLLGSRLSPSSLDSVPAAAAGGARLAGRSRARAVTAPNSLVPAARVTISLPNPSVRDETLNPPGTRNRRISGGFLQSGRPDLNRGPLVPQTSALTRLRHAPCAQDNG